MKKALLIILLIVLTGTAVLVHYLYQKTENSEEAFLLRVLSDGKEEAIKPWKSDDGHIHVFLPSYAKMEDVTVELSITKRVLISGIRIINGMTLEAFSTEQEYDLLVGYNSPMKLRFVSSVGIPTMFIQTESGNMDSVHADKTYKESAIITLYTSDGIIDYQTKENDRIRGRGNSTWNYLKKPYNLYLDNSADLLCLGAAKHWVLLANAIEETNLRNWLVFRFADRIGTYDGFSPGCELIDLYLNGEYSGLYLLCEKTEIAENRLEVSKKTFLFNLDVEFRKDTLDNYFLLNPGSVVEIKNPDPCSPEQQELLETRLLEMQNAFMTGDFHNLAEMEATGQWLDYIDLDSWAKKYLIEEVFQNYDAGVSSQYYFWNREDDKIYAGPCWDYDNILGNHAFYMSPKNFLALREWVDAETYTPWYAALWSKEEFREYVKKTYQEEFIPELSKFLEDDFSKERIRIKQASEADYLRWPDKFAGQKHFEDAISFMLDFLSRRIAFLNSAWIDGAEYCTVTIKPGKGRFLYYSVLPGTQCEDLPDTKKYGLEDVSYWLDEETGEPFDPDTIITEDVILYAEYQE